MSEEAELLRLLRAAVDRERPYAGFFDWPDRSVAEIGIASTFVAAAHGEVGFPLRDLRSRRLGEDPPDCEATDQTGARIALEVTELVDEEAIVRARRSGGNEWAQWDAPKLIDAIQARLRAKGTKRLKGGPYAEYIVLIHTDEPALSIEIVANALADAQFTAAVQVGRAYLLLSYHPGRGYPFVRLI